MPTTAEIGTSLYLSRLRLNLRGRQVQRDLANSQALHRRLLDVFPDATTRAAVGLLYRVEVRPQHGGPEYVVLVQAAVRPDWTRLGASYLVDERASAGDSAAETKTVAERYTAIATGDTFRFRLRANPTRKHHFRPQESARPTGPNGTRLPLLTDAELQGWIARKGEQHGFRLLGVQWRPDPISGNLQRGTKADGRSLVHYAIVFDGVLEVTDAGAFRTALASGVGPAKAYGFGLLSLAPASA